MIGTPKGSKHFNPVFLGSGRAVLTSSRRQYWNMLLLHDKAIHHPLKIWGAFHLHPSTLYPLSLVTSLCLKHAWSFFMSPRLCSLRIGRQRQRQQRRRGGTLSVSEKLWRGRRWGVSECSSCIPVICNRWGQQQQTVCQILFTRWQFNIRIFLGVFISSKRVDWHRGNS